MKVLSIAILVSTVSIASAQTMPPPIFTFAPGSRFDVVYAIAPPTKDTHHWDSAVAASTPFAELQLRPNVFLTTNLLGGVSLNHQVLTGGYSVCARVDFSFRSSPVDGSLSAGFDQLYAQGSKAPIGLVFGFSVWFSPKNS